MFNPRNNARRLFGVAKKLRGNESGVTLLETLVALAILGLVAVAFLSALTTAARATIIADEQATAESLVRSQIEYVKSQDYIDYDDPGHLEYELLESEKIPTSYSVEVTVELLDPENDGLDDDDGIQKITVTVNRNERLVLTIEDYKVDR